MFKQLIFFVAIGCASAQLKGSVNVTIPLPQPAVIPNPTGAINGAVQGVLGRVGGAIKGGLGGTRNAITGALTPLGLGGVGELVGSGIDGADGLVQGAIGSAQGVTNGLLGGLGGVLGTAGDLAKNALGGAQGALGGVGGALGGLGGVVGPALGTVGGLAQNGLQTGLGIGQGFGKQVGGLVQGLGGVQGTLGKTVQSIQKTLSKLLNPQTNPSKVTGLLNQLNTDLGKVIQGTGSKVLGLLGGLQGGQLTNELQGQLISAINPLLSVSGVISSAVAKLENQLQSAVGEDRQRIEGLIGDIISAVQNQVQEILPLLTSGRFGDLIGNLLASVQNTVQGALGSLVLLATGTFGSALNTPQTAGSGVAGSAQWTAGGAVRPTGVQGNLGASGSVRIPPVRVPSVGIAI